MMGRAAARAFAGLAAGVVGFHLAVILGAPWGHLTMGGRWDRALPGPARILSGLSALLVAGMALAVLARAGVVGLRLPQGAMGAVLALAGLGVLANALTPSGAERALWLPVTLAMLAAALLVPKA